MPVSRARSSHSSRSKKCPQGPTQRGVSSSITRKYWAGMLLEGHVRTSTSDRFRARRTSLRVRQRRVARRGAQATGGAAGGRTSRQESCTCGPCCPHSPIPADAPVAEDGRPEVALAREGVHVPGRHLHDVLVHLVQPQHVRVPLPELPPGSLAPRLCPRQHVVLWGLLLQQPQRLLVRDARLELELDHGEVLEGDEGAHEGAGAVAAEVALRNGGGRRMVGKMTADAAVWRGDAGFELAGAEEGALSHAQAGGGPARRIACLWERDLGAEEREDVTWVLRSGLTAPQR